MVRRISCVYGIYASTSMLTPDFNSTVMWSFQIPMFAAFSSGSFKQEIVVPLQLMPKSILIVVDILLHFVILKYD